MPEWVLGQLCWVQVVVLIHVPSALPGSAPLLPLLGAALALGIAAARQVRVDAADEAARLLLRQPLEVHRRRSVACRPAARKASMVAPVAMGSKGAGRRPGRRWLIGRREG